MGNKLSMGNVQNNNLDTKNYSIVLVNYKTHELTSICLKLLYKIFKDSGVQVWVVDNDSADESTEYLRSLDWIHLIERMPVPDEPGFMAHGCALDLVLDEITTDYLFLLHTDTLIHDPEIFKLTRTKKPKFISGVPPDFFSRTGQLWGNPIYNWQALKNTGYSIV